MKTNIYFILLKNDKVNNYTKIILILNQLAYNQDFYIPNRKLINICKKKNIKIDTRQIQRILTNLTKERLINLYYQGNKRYFTLNNLYEID